MPHAPSIAPPEVWQSLPMADTHCHYDFPPFDDDRATEWHAAQGLGVARMIIPGVVPSQWPRAEACSRALEGVYWAPGQHPCWAPEGSAEALAGELYAALSRPKAIALGECGLDKLQSGCEPAEALAAQQPYLDVQLSVASERCVPVLLHCRRAHNELIRALKRHTLPAGGVVHAFAGSAQQVRDYARLGFLVGVGGICTYPRPAKTRAALAEAPASSLLLETDGPDMPLCGRQGLRNSPTALPHILNTLAELRGAAPEALAAQIEVNATRLFGWGP